MDKSFHYYGVRVLAEKAGFSQEESQTIAYAGQYTDDATEFGPMIIAGIPRDFDFPRFDARKNTFDPICTAHSASSWLTRLWKWAKFYLKADVHRKILMPFHFLPPRPLAGNGSGAFDFVTRANSPLANALMDQAIACLAGATGQTRDYGLIKLGIAMHTYADTWAHAGFSGRHNPRENDITDIRVRRGKTFKRANPFEALVSYAAPDVGHSEAGTLPDTTATTWKAGYAHLRGGIIRSNPEAFLEAAREIYGRLVAVSGKPPVKWTALSPRISECLLTQTGWETAFPEVCFAYNRFEWRAKALTGDSIHWDNFDDEADFKKLNLKFTGTDMKWLFFHKAAHEQRRFVMEHIPALWENG